MQGRELKVQASRAQLQLKQWPVAEAVEEAEVGEHRNVGRHTPKFADDRLLQVRVIVVGIGDDQSTLIQVQAPDERRGLAGPCDREHYILTHSIASTM
ncbi:hypothetical protein D9M70_566150 [compost metagenome]